MKQSILVILAAIAISYVLSELLLGALNVCHQNIINYASHLAIIFLVDRFSYCLVQWEAYGAVYMAQIEFACVGSDSLAHH